MIGLVFGVLKDAALAAYQRVRGERVTRVGVAAIVRRPDGRVLVGRRRGKFGDGEWALPGGKLREGETPAECVVREVAEEAGLALRVDKVTMLPVYTYDGGRPGWPDFVTLWGVVEVSDLAHPLVLEPEKCSEWRWVHRHELPEPLFRCLRTGIDAGVPIWGGTVERVTVTTMGY